MLLVLAPSWLGLLGDWHWMADLLAHFRWQYLLASAVVLALAAWRRLRAVAALAAATLLLNGALIAQLAWPTDASRADPAAGFTLRVLGINVLRSNPDTDAVLRHALESDADVVLLIEIDQRWLHALEPLKSRYPHHLAEPRPDNFGIAVFSRLPWEEATLLHFAAGGPPSIQLQITHQGRRFVLIGTHPVPPVGRGAALLRDTHLRALADHVAGLPVPALVVGDLNASPWSDGMRRLTAHNLAAGSRNPPWTPTWRARSLLAIPIDHALASPPLVITSRTVGPDLGSDHRPLAVELGWADR